MGMFDYFHYNGKMYQTKDTPAQALETYELRDDGLWYKDTEREWEDTEDALSFFGGYLKEISHEWRKLISYDGLIHFYDYHRNPDGTIHDEEWKVLLMDGNILKLERLK
jgi:hypothetical protein